MTIIWHAMCGDCGSRTVFESDERREVPVELMAWLYDHDVQGSVYYYTKNDKYGATAQSFWKNLWRGFVKRLKRVLSRRKAGV